jgi:hypothetical protein
VRERRAAHATLKIQDEPKRNSRGRKKDQGKYKRPRSTQDLGHSARGGMSQTPSESSDFSDQCNPYIRHL